MPKLREVVDAEARGGTCDRSAWPRLPGRGVASGPDCDWSCLMRASFSWIWRSSGCRRSLTSAEMRSSICRVASRASFWREGRRG